MDFNLDTTYSYNNDIHKSKIIKYKPNNLAAMNTVNTNINILHQHKVNGVLVENLHACVKKKC